jgi:alanine racemase
MQMDFKGKRKTAAIVNLNSIKHNLNFIKKTVGNAKICAVVKANSYGHGAKQVSTMIIKEQLADYLAVATVEEGIELRNQGIQMPILLLGVTFNDQYESCLDHDLTITITSTEDIKALNSIADNCSKIANAHLKVDTGMGRIGANPENKEELAKEILQSPNINMEGIFSHFSDSSNKEYSRKQIDTFKPVAGYFEKSLEKKLIKHIANSGAILGLPESYMDMVRPGIILYGYQAFDNLQSDELKPGMVLRTEISFVKYAKKGTFISYGASTQTKEDGYIATLPIGYADGISRSLSNKMKVVIEGKMYHQIGTITMDQIMINLGQDYKKTGTEVFIFDDHLYTADHYAETMRTIPYEVTCNVSKRVTRYYK